MGSSKVCAYAARNAIVLCRISFSKYRRNIQQWLNMQSEQALLTESCCLIIRDQFVYLTLVTEFDSEMFWKERNIFCFGYILFLIRL